MKGESGLTLGPKTLKKYWFEIFFVPIVQWVYNIYKKGLENDNYYVVTCFWTSTEQIIYKGKDFLDRLVYI